MKHLLTASRLVKFQRCARAHHYRYELGVAPVQSAPALAFGTAIHAALEAFWRAWMTDGYGSTESALDALEGQGLDALSLVKARVMVAAYCARYMRLAARSTVLAVEVEFSAPLVDPDSGIASTRWLLAGKIDAIVRLPDGRVAIVEHKTSGRDASAGSDYRARLTLDAQVGIYFDGAEALGYAADLCLYDVLVKPSMEPALATPRRSGSTPSPSRGPAGSARRRRPPPGRTSTRRRRSSAPTARCRRTRAASSTPTSATATRPPRSTPSGSWPPSRPTRTATWSRPSSSALPRSATTAAATWPRPCARSSSPADMGTRPVVLSPASCTAGANTSTPATRLR